MAHVLNIPTTYTEAQGDIKIYNPKLSAVTLQLRYTDTEEIFKEGETKEFEVDAAKIILEAYPYFIDPDSEKYSPDYTHAACNFKEEIETEIKKFEDPKNLKFRDAVIKKLDDLAKLENRSEQEIKEKYRKQLEEELKEKHKVLQPNKFKKLERYGYIKTIQRLCDWFFKRTRDTDR